MHQRHSHVPSVTDSLLGLPYICLPCLALQIRPPHGAVLPGTPCTEEALQRSSLQPRLRDSVTPALYARDGHVHECPSPGAASVWLSRFWDRTKAARGGPAAAGVIPNLEYRPSRANGVGYRSMIAPRIPNVGRLPV